MSRDIWSPSQYERFADERSRPFFELAARVRADRPANVVDLGCGSGELTETLADRWPSARVHGLDSSEAMIARAPAGRVEYAVADLTDWRPDTPVDVLISNAALQWVPSHRDLFPRWADRLAGTVRTEAPPVAGPEEYLARLTGLGCAVDAWETTYLHVLQGDDPVLEWVKGTALRPVLARLDAADRTAFLDECAVRLREAYPPRPYGTIFPFRRVFVVARSRPA